MFPVNRAGGQRGPSQARVPPKTDVKMNLTPKLAGASGQCRPSQARVPPKTDVKVDLTPKPAGASGQPGPSQATVPPKTDVKVDLIPKPAGDSGQPGPSQAPPKTHVKVDLTPKLTRALGQRVPPTKARVPPKTDVQVDLTPKPVGDSGQPGPSQAPPKTDVKVDFTPKPAGDSGQPGPSQAPPKTHVKVDLTPKLARALGQRVPLTKARVPPKTDVQVDLTPKPAGDSGQPGPSQAPPKTDVKVDLIPKPAGDSGQPGPSQAPPKTHVKVDLTPKLTRALGQRVPPTKARVPPKTDVQVDLTPKPAGDSGQPGPSQAPPKTDVKVDFTSKPAGASGQPGRVPPKTYVKVDLTPKPAGDSGQPGPSAAPPKTDVKVDLTPKPGGVSVDRQLPTPGVNSLNITSGFSLAHTPRTFTYDELATATDRFSDSNLLGQGGFGYVHKGVLPNGKIVAVKQLKAESRQGEREFHAEVEVISRVHHRHLVSLVGYCISDSQRMLVYEFVPNKTLEFHLHGEDRPAMEWSTRMKVATGSAKGLAYLHEDCNPRIIHRDIKASNILLDNNFEAKVADFGLAKFLSDTRTHVSTVAKGTFGYLDPEYLASRRLTEKSDVYSFGVVLLVLITGRKALDETVPHNSIIEWARHLLSQDSKNINFDELVDPRLAANYNRDEMIRMTTCAGACVRQTATHRPKMSLVLRALEGNTSLEELNEGSIPGHENSEDLKKLWKLALEGQEPGVSEYSGPSREHGQHPSVPSSSGQQNTQEKEMGNVKGSSHGSGMSY